MNRLWIRSQNFKQTKEDRDKLKPLIGENIVRLTKMECVTEE